jgi:hypothetical protein
MDPWESAQNRSRPLRCGAQNFGSWPGGLLVFFLGVDLLLLLCRRIARRVGWSVSAHSFSETRPRNRRMVASGEQEGRMIVNTS